MRCFFQLHVTEQICCHFNRCSCQHWLHVASHRSCDLKLQVYFFSQCHVFCPQPHTWYAHKHYALCSQALKFGTNDFTCSVSSRSDGGQPVCINHNKSVAGEISSLSYFYMKQCYKVCSYCSPIVFFFKPVYWSQTKCTI